MGRIEWIPLAEMPPEFKDGRQLLLWIDNPFAQRYALVRWYEPWGNWLEDELPDDPTEGEIYGIGAKVPTHFAEINPPTWIPTGFTTVPLIEKAESRVDRKRGPYKKRLTA